MLWIATPDDYGYDEHAAMVVRAPDETTALKIVHAVVTRDCPGPDPAGGDWYAEYLRQDHNPEFAQPQTQTWTVQPLTVDGPDAVICAAFNAG